MKCSECEDLIYDYLDNELEFDIGEQMKLHLEECLQCNNNFLDMQQALATFKDELNSVKVSEDFTQKVMLEINNQEVSNFFSYAIVGLLGSMGLAVIICTILLYPVLQIVTKYTVEFFTLWLRMASALSFDNVLLVFFSIVLLFIAMAMRGVMHMEEGQV